MKGRFSKKVQVPGLMRDTAAHRKARQKVGLRERPGKSYNKRVVWRHCGPSDCVLFSRSFGRTIADL